MEHIISMVTNADSIVDVGCDHGYISIALVKRNIVNTALAMDINEGPLKTASKNIADEGLENKIKTCLSNGLKAYNLGQADTLIIAGMGGPLICDILSDDWNKTHSFKQMIISPQSKIPETRKFLYDNGYKIIDEDMVIDDGKYYVIIKAVLNDDNSSIDDCQMTLGPVLLNKKHKVLKQFIDKTLINDNKIIKLLKDDSDKNIARKRELMAEIDLLENGLGYF